MIDLFSMPLGFSLPPPGAERRDALRLPFAEALLKDIVINNFKLI